MPSFTLYTYFAAVALLLANIVTAFPLERRGVDWSFELHPFANCTGAPDLHYGSGSTGCRADLDSVASAYTLNGVADGCRIDFFDNTMCDASEMSDVVGPMTPTATCRVAGSKRRFGSYLVTCRSDELK
ncbi:uncharacterized protein N7459_000853 [Penicillium hispanicum]|uniref:uncharacterized protein n=1 Tax=Penicillium hispanicum TaxID=1080232 RepID=UPI00253FFDC2|nr:uncharacterized protein N7459_000853 [Penicillium hispanicum]KAJ5594645.1 hypothetical protein N7459_000853 [Penicillium hispanicum]